MSKKIIGFAVVFLCVAGLTFWFLRQKPVNDLLIVTVTPMGVVAEAETEVVTPAAGEGGSAESEAAEPAVESVATVEPTEAETPLAATELPQTNPAAGDAEAVADSQRELVILYTNDEHGWLEGVEAGRGAAEMVGIWNERFGCDTGDHCLILSGGDMWTGPAISTWFEGRSMAEVMNAMGYAAAAVGNHEFDFGPERLKVSAEASAFPFVSANIRAKGAAELKAEYGIEPYTLVERNGITVGIVGLSTTLTPQTTLPQHVAALEFVEYAEALAAIVPEVRAAGADIVVVPGHICLFEVAALAATLDVAMVGGGHCNQLLAQVDINTNVVGLIGGSHLQTYAFAEMMVDSADGSWVFGEVGTAKNEGGVPDAAVAELVKKWRGLADEELNEVIGYLDAPIERRSAEMQDLIAYSWLSGYPSADLAVTNLGGMRDSWAAGELSLADIIGVMPFDNVIVEVKLTGREFVSEFGPRDDVAIAGVEQLGTRWTLVPSGAELDLDAEYSVLVNNFMYGGGDGFSIHERDPDGYNSAIDWRQPLIDWAMAQESSETKPLNGLIENLKQ